MRERPILFSGAMVRALLAGTKTQTRRLVKLPHQNPLGQWEPMTIGGLNGGRTARGETIPEQGGIWHTRTGDGLMCPFGQPGDRLWVREAWRTVAEADALPPRDLTAAHRNWYEVDAPHQPGAGRYRPPMFMPRWVSRILLEITAVRVERLQAISEADCIAEGIEKTKYGYWSLYGQHATEGTYSPRASYHALWQSINGPDSWSANPWVWVVEFKVLEARP